MEINLQRQYDLIYFFLKTSTEPFDKLDWDGSRLKVLLDENVIEKCSVSDVKELINDFYYAFI